MEIINETKKITPDGLKKIFSLIKDLTDNMDKGGIEWEDTLDDTDYEEVW